MMRSLSLYNFEYSCFRCKDCFHGQHEGEKMDTHYIFNCARQHFVAQSAFLIRSKGLSAKEGNAQDILVHSYRKLWTSMDILASGGDLRVNANTP